MKTPTSPPAPPAAADEAEAELAGDVAAVVPELQPTNDKAAANATAQVLQHA